MRAPFGSTVACGEFGAAGGAKSNGDGNSNSNSNSNSKDSDNTEPVRCTQNEKGRGLRGGLFRSIRKNDYLPLRLGT